MVRRWIIGLSLVLVFGCRHKPGRMEQPEDPQGRYREQIAVARRVLEQNEDWADRVEWEVLKSGDGWEVVAWRIEHPERKGAARYAPWGRSIIELDRRNVAVDYHRKG
jgi:hypothetical protein